MSYGWLEPKPDIVRDQSHFGVRMKPDVDTRWEEFTLARDILSDLEPGRVLDAGCGFEPYVHTMPEIAAHLGWHVEAIDLLKGRQWQHLFHLWDTFDDHPKINRRIMDMCDTDYPDESFDAYLNISVLEHVDHETRDRAVVEARRVLKPGGVAVFTFDNLWPYMVVDGFDFGEPVVPPRPLCNEIGEPVSFAVGVRR